MISQELQGYLIAFPPKIWNRVQLPRKSNYLICEPWKILLILSNQMEHQE